MATLLPFFLVITYFPPSAGIPYLGLIARMLKRWFSLVFQNEMPFTIVIQPTPKVVEYSSANKA